MGPLGLLGMMVFVGFTLKSVLIVVACAMAAVAGGEPSMLLALPLAALEVALFWKLWQFARAEDEHHRASSRRRNQVRAAGKA